MRIKATTILLMILTMHKINAQVHNNDSERGFRVVGVIGHTLVNTDELDKVWVPSWGLDAEYWFNQKWGIGMHNDVEIETFVIQNFGNDQLERINPLVLSIDALYHIGKGCVITLGPGIEKDKNRSFYLFRAGIEYEKDISKSIYLVPNIFFDQRFDGFNTLNIGLGMGMRLYKPSRI